MEYSSETMTDDMLQALQSLADWSASGSEADPRQTAPAVLSALETLAGRGPWEGEDRAAVHRLLGETGKSAFLRGLKTAGLRGRWAEAAFRLIRNSGYSLLDLFRARVLAHPAKVLFQDMSAPIPPQWTYEQVERTTREIAAAFLLLGEADGRPPRVAIFSENSLSSACADLACLFYDILDSPLNIHFGPDSLIDIFNHLGVTIAVTDTPARRRLLEEVRTRTAAPFTIVVLDQAAGESTDARFLDALCKTMGRADVERLLASRRRLALNETATVMFTSGSTGRPKGVSFSIYQLTAKRFARAAALPEVGGDEVFLSFLPFFHTFGRYLELLGAIYWSGTYVFPGNTSAETLFALFPKVRPTGFISVPIRWAQLHERCLEALGAAGPEVDSAAVLAGVLGSRLRWGLSAAGYLDAKVFRFFEKHGVLLASGFGMTEGTGGITMTVPGEYVDNTHGRPLPGVEARLSPAGELQVRGDYIARYLDDAGPGALIPYPVDAASDYWLSTGDVFKVLPNGYYQIVDRLKDIYKNTRGETIAPLKVENKFIGVPGFKRTFLVGDGRPTNVLFIVPDHDDEVLQAALAADTERAYYRRIVGAANLDLAPYERVVNFALLDRDFDGQRGELTPKGSFNRKTIEAHFAAEIEDLYKRNYIELDRGDVRVRIPIWFFRDLGILEDEIFFVGDSLFDSNRKLKLTIIKGEGAPGWTIGDLEYALPAPVVDLGYFARQPRLWLGNPALVRFSPCKTGWDVPLDPALDSVRLPDPRLRIYADDEIPKRGRFLDARLAQVNALVSAALLADDAAALAALDSLERELAAPELRTAEVIRRRLEALSRHPAEAVRCAAYRILLLDEPNPGYNQALMSFLHSGRTFLSQASIEMIASSPLGQQGRFDAVRRRMCAYREELAWPAPEATRVQLRGILRLFVDFAHYHPEFFRSVRAELAAWILHRADPELSRAAETLWMELNAAAEESLSGRIPALDAGELERRLVFDDGLSAAEAGRIRVLLADRTFLAQSIELVFDADDFDPRGIADGGLWVSRLPEYGGRPSVRVSINMRDGRHYDLRLVLGTDLGTPAEIESVYWHLAIADYPLGRPILPLIGAFRPDRGALAIFYSSELNVWERIRLFAAERGSDGPDPVPGAWRKLFIEGLSAFFKGWQYASSRLVPGLPAPTNVMVPQADFREEPMIHSLAGRTAYTDTLSLVRPLLINFYRKCEAHYPWSRGQLDAAWIFDACYEALGYAEAAIFFNALQEDLVRQPLLGSNGVPLGRALQDYLADFRANAMIPLAALNAIARYKEWQLQSGSEDADERERMVREFFRLYRLDRYPEVARYHLYRHTYFAGAKAPVLSAFDKLLEKMSLDLQRPAVQLLELSDLQAALLDESDRLVFGKMVFPRLARSRKLDILTTGDEGRKRVIVQSTLADVRGDSYSFGETFDPAEIGRLYRLFFKENYPKSISEQDRHYVLRDSREQVVGGLCFRMMFKNAAFIDGIVVAGDLKGRGLGGTMVDDFAQRMAGSGVSLILTNFFLPDFFIHKGFKVDKRWGALVREL